MCVSVLQNKEGQHTWLGRLHWGYPLQILHHCHVNSMTKEHSSAGERFGVRLGKKEKASELFRQKLNKKL